MNTKTLYQSVLTTANRCPALVNKAEFVKNNFIKAFSLFAKCRDIYDTSKILDDGDITLLGNIEKYIRMCYSLLYLRRKPH